MKYYIDYEAMRNNSIIEGIWSGMTGWDAMNIRKFYPYFARSHSSIDENLIRASLSEKDGT